MLRAEDGATFRMTIEPAEDQVRVSWTVAQGSGAAALTETDTNTVATVEDARRWGHAAARARGFKKIRVKNSIAVAA
jgi:hypothetical protein